MRRTDMAVLIEYIRAHSESSAIDDALDALAAAAHHLHPAGEAVASRAVNSLHAHLIDTGDRIGADMLANLTFEDVTL